MTEFVDINPFLTALDSLALLNASFGLEYASRFVDASASASFKLGSQFCLNYHFGMATLEPVNCWRHMQLHANTVEFRNLTESKRQCLLSEEARIKSLFNTHLSQTVGQVFANMLYAEYWVNLLDGFRVSLWLYRALQAADRDTPIPAELNESCNDLKNLVLASTKTAVGDNGVVRTPEVSVYAEFDRAIEYLTSHYGTPIEQLKSQFVPRLRPLLLPE
jgi:hypothetical protein